MRNALALHRQHSNSLVNHDIASGLIRILVIDDDSELLDQLENALWVWPHKIVPTATVEDAIRLCRHLTPSAILVSVDADKSSETRSVPALRRRLPTVPIITLVSPGQYIEPGRFLDQGADALLLREDAHRPTLHDLLISVQRNPDSEPRAARVNTPELALPWSQSEMLGALICDITGSIVDANAPLASWLGYSNPDDLRGRNVLRNLLTNRDDWARWIQVAGDTSAIHSENTGVIARNGQMLWVRLEVFAAPKHPSYLQAVFTDQTELAMLSRPAVG